MTPAHGRLRLIRTASFAVATLTLAVTAHALAAGVVPAGSTILLAGVLVLLVSHGLSARRRRAPALVAVLALLETGLHVLFHLAGPGSPVAGVAGPEIAGSGIAGASAASSALGHGAAGMTAHHHGSVALDTVGTGATWSQLLDALGLSPAMIAGHALATVLTALILAHGEEILWQLAQQLPVIWHLPVVPQLPTALPTATPRRLVAPQHVFLSQRGPRAPPQMWGTS